MDPVVIDRGSGHKPSTTFPTSSVARTSNNFEESIGREGTTATGEGRREAYMETSRLGSEDLPVFSLVNMDMLLSYQSPCTQCGHQPSRFKSVRNVIVFLQPVNTRSAHVMTAQSQKHRRLYLQLAHPATKDEPAPTGEPISTSACGSQDTPSYLQLQGHPRSPPLRPRHRK